MSQFPDNYSIGIIGATGYTGEELLRILARHEQVTVSFVTSEHEQGQALAYVYPQLPHYHNLKFISATEAAEMMVDLVFLCLPAGESGRIAEHFLNKGIKVIDLGPDFRFYNPQDYFQWYRQEHPCPQLLQETVYGLPEWNRYEINKARIVGNPGCYPTSVLLSILPFAVEGMIANAPIIIDSKSGVSGSGKTPGKTTHYVQINESVQAYKPGRSHRHVGEMEQELHKWSAKNSKIIFSPHLVPMTRGILSSIYLPLKSNASKKELTQILEKRYGEEPFVHVLENEIPSTGMAAHTNHCFLSLEMPDVQGKNDDEQYVIIFSAIDNLGKGASWQAVQNMNLMLGLAEVTGLL
jgi:N-acetyl-gamma-glutamyl-phosphate reductase